jgi:branched-chain amino acid transport system substrate-binding protein
MKEEDRVRSSVIAGRRRAVTAVAVLPVLVAMFGCGSSDDGGTATSAPAKTASSAASGSTTSSPAAKAATGTPIKIGYITDVSGAGAYAQFLPTMKASVDYINKQAGGVNGRPLDVTYCEADGSPENAVACANKLVEQKASVAVQGYALGSDAMVPILKAAKIPLVSRFQIGPVQSEASNAFNFGAATPAYLTGAMQFYAKQGAKRIRFFLADAPFFHGLDTQLKAIASSLGLDYKTIFYPADAPNWSVVATTAIADKPDVVGSTSSTDSDCKSFVPALRSAGYTGTIFAGACTGVLKELGSAASGTQVYTDHWSAMAAKALPADQQQPMSVYLDLMNKTGNSKYIPTNGITQFADALILQKALATVDGPVTGATAEAALRKIKDEPTPLGPEISCDGTVWPKNSSCAASLLFYKSDGSGNLTPVSSGFLHVTPTSSGE